MIPEHLKADIEQKSDISITRAINLSGGSINEAAKIITADDQEFFLKWNLGSLKDMFDVEISGLDLLRNHSSMIRIPEIVQSGITENEAVSWLLMEYIEQGRTDGDFFDTFGRALADLHQQSNTQFGLAYDNYIGRLPQKNTFESDWISFFISHRIQPQVELAEANGLLQPSVVNKFDSFYEKLPELIPDEPPALLHGDLWSGNFLASKSSQPVLVDPAVYYGHREAELAFTKLFGGFSSAFYNAYNEAFPLVSGFEQRVDFFNIYPLLVHVNLFGHAYTSQVTSIINRF